MMQRSSDGSQYELRWRLRSVYDRQEINDILQHLKEENHLYFRQEDGSRYLVLPLDDEEEKEIFWFIGDRGWYQA
jgi:transcription factor C subunit 3